MVFHFITTGFLYQYYKAIINIRVTRRWLRRAGQPPVVVAEFFVLVLALRPHSGWECSLSTSHLRNPMQLRCWCWKITLCGGDVGYWQINAILYFYFTGFPSEWENVPHINWRAAIYVPAGGKGAGICLCRRPISRIGKKGSCLLNKLIWPANSHSPRSSRLRLGLSSYCYSYIIKKLWVHMTVFKTVGEDETLCCHCRALPVMPMYGTMFPLFCQQKKRNLSSDSRGSVTARKTKWTLKKSVLFHFYVNLCTHTSERSRTQVVRTNMYNLHTHCI